MAHIVIFLSSYGPAESGDTIVYEGQARLSGMSPSDPSINWHAEASPSALASTINDAIKDAAIAAAEDAEYTVGALDKKTLVAGAIGL